jgi:hypothetical protein
MPVQGVLGEGLRGGHDIFLAVAPTLSESGTCLRDELRRQTLQLALVRIEPRLLLLPLS